MFSRLAILPLRHAAVVRLVLVCALAGVLSGCGPFLWPDRIPPVEPVELLPVLVGGSVGQTFVARHAGLQSISVFLATEGGSGDARLTLHLRASALPGEQDLRAAEIRLQAPLAPGWQTFMFAPLSSSPALPLYFFVEAELPDGATLQSGVAPGATYLDGSLYLAHMAIDGQLAFRLGYEQSDSAYVLLTTFGMMPFSLGVLVLLFILPGLALQLYLLPLASGAWKEQLGLAIGLSLSIYPLLLLGASVLGVRPGAMTVWLPLGLAAIALVARWWQAGHPLRPGGSLTTIRESLGPATVVLLLALLVLFVRIFVLRAADAPLWGDSVQHVMIAQRIVDHGGLFASWQPYAPYETLTVHFGFHTLVAVVMWFTGASVSAATLLTGQIVNFAAIFTLVPLASRILRSPWAGAGVLIVAGLLSPLPNLYINWGRYSQLAGQAILPIAVWLLWSMIDASRGQRKRYILPMAIIWSGIFLTYYRMPYYVAIFALLVLVLHLFRTWRAGWRAIASPLLTLLATAGLALVFVLPWLLRLRSGTLVEVVEMGVTEGASLALTWLELSVLFAPTPLLPRSLLVLAGAGLLWAAWRRQASVALIALWTIGILLLPAARLARIPGGNSLQGFAVLISLYIPLGLLGGYLIDGGLSWLARRGRVFVGIALLVLAVPVLTAAGERLRAVDPAYRILAPADVRAMEWVEQHTPEDAFFLVDGFLIFGGRSAVGSDGGWWLPLLTHRRNTMPPQYALLSERPSDPAFNSLVVDLVTDLRDVGVTSAAGVDLLCRAGITHVYVGQGQGRIAMPPVEPMLVVAELETSPAFTNIYRQDKVRVFELNATACS